MGEAGAEGMLAEPVTVLHLHRQLQMTGRGDEDDLCPENSELGKESGIQNVIV